MEAGFSQAQAQRVLKQRNMLVIASTGLAIVTIFSLIAASARDREIVLQPVLTRQVELSSSGVSREYLGLVTRDASVLMLNRSPSSLDYWLESVLKIVHPSAYGRIKGDLLKIVNDQRGSSVSQYFTMESMRVDPQSLMSETTGTLHTRSEEHTSELQSLMRISYAVFCLKKKNNPKNEQPHYHDTKSLATAT